MSYYEQLRLRADKQEPETCRVEEFWKKEIEPQIEANLLERYVEIPLGENEDMRESLKRYAIEEKGFPSSKAYCKFSEESLSNGEYVYHTLLVLMW